MTRRFSPLVDWVAHEGGNDPWALHWEARNALARGENVISSQFEEDRLADEEAQADLLAGGAGSIEGDYVES